jgi:hypothetical protein
VPGIEPGRSANQANMLLYITRPKRIAACEFRIADLKSAAVILVDLDLLAAIKTNPQSEIHNSVMGLPDRLELSFPIYKTGASPAMLRKQDWVCRIEPAYD